VTGGPVWGAASEDLNATILMWPAGAGPQEHVNESRDVLYVVVVGSARLTVDGEDVDLDAGEAHIVAKGSQRTLVAGPEGVTYATAHLRRPGLEIRSPRTSRP
jgi:mannose-6-phosphate isomerase-like protein (cupin superfamily)